MHGFEYSVFTGKLEMIPYKWINQSQGWKKSGELILYDVIESDASLLMYRNKINSPLYYPN
jgi:hypothetical protein